MFKQQIAMALIRLHRSADDLRLCFLHTCTSKIFYNKYDACNCLFVVIDVYEIYHI